MKHHHHHWPRQNIDDVHDVVSINDVSPPTWDTGDQVCIMWYSDDIDQTLLLTTAVTTVNSRHCSSQIILNFQIFFNKYIQEQLPVESLNPSIYLHACHSNNQHPWRHSTNTLIFHTLSHLIFSILSLDTSFPQQKSLRTLPASCSYQTLNSCLIWLFYKYNLQQDTQEYRGHCLQIIHFHPQLENIILFPTELSCILSLTTCFIIFFLFAG